MFVFLSIEVSNDPDEILADTKLTNSFGAKSSVSLGDVALAFGLHKSWLAQEVASEICWVLRLLYLRSSLSVAHSVVRASES